MTRPADAGARGEDARALAAPERSSFTARAEAGPELLRSPVSGTPCVHWRLRVVEHLTARSELVHDFASSEPFELAWQGAGGDGRPAVRARIDPESARIEATPILHREGTPGALAVARAFGFSGVLSVHEIVVRAGDQLTAEGILEDAAAGVGPFRGVAFGLELLDATVRVPSRSLAPALLPWALGTAAALLGGMGLATWAAWQYHVAHLPPHAYRRLVGSSPAELTPPAPLRNTIP